MRKKNGNELVGIIGTGRFGMAVAEELLARGRDVIAIDKDPAMLRKLTNTNADIFVINDMSMESLMETGIQEADTVIIGIGKDIENSILATLNVIEMGVKRVIAKVISDDHAKILYKLGAEVVFPEIEIGRRTALRLCENLAEDILPLSDEFSILQMKTPDALDGKSVGEIGIRSKYGISLIAAVKDGKASGNIGPDTVLLKDETIVLSGSNKSLDRFQEIFS